MVSIETLRLVCYIVDAFATLLLAGYFLREYMAKRLRASLAWCLGFILFTILMLQLAFFTTIVELSKLQVMIAFTFAAALVSLLYYGGALLYFGKKSFFREKATVLFFFVVLLIGSVLTSITEEKDLIERVGPPTGIIYGIAYVVIGTFFLQVSGKLPKEDPRRRTLTVVGLAWYIIAGWNTYVGLFFKRFPLLEPIVFLVGSFGFLLLLYGMTTGKTIGR